MNLCLWLQSIPSLPNERAQGPDVCKDGAARAGTVAFRMRRRSARQKGGAAFDQNEPRPPSLDRNGLQIVYAAIKKIHARYCCCDRISLAERAPCRLDRPT